MLKEHPSFLKQAIAVIDCGLIIAAFALSHFIDSHYKPLSPAPNYWLMLVGFIAFYLYFAWTRQLFSVLQFNWVSHLFWRIVFIFMSAGMLGAAILYVMPDRYNSRTLYLIFAAVSFLFIACEKLMLREFFSQIRHRNRNISPIIPDGSSTCATMSRAGSSPRRTTRCARCPMPSSSRRARAISPGRSAETAWK
jgi:FlaA1/EpsC-like NDP-sugar epimerase